MSCAVKSSVPGLSARTRSGVEPSAEPLAGVRAAATAGATSQRTLPLPPLSSGSGVSDAPAGFTSGSHTQGSVVTGGTSERGRTRWISSEASRRGHVPLAGQGASPSVFGEACSEPVTTLVPGACSRTSSHRHSV